MRSCTGLVNEISARDVTTLPRVIVDTSLPLTTQAHPSRLPTLVSRPNTSLLFDLTSPHPFPMPPIPLRGPAWRVLLQRYPDRTFAESLVEACQYGVKIGYSGPGHAQSMSNLKTSLHDVTVLDEDLQNNLQKGRISQRAATQHIAQSMGLSFVSSPLGLVPKADGGFRRIHHLSAPPKGSINDGIPVHFGHLKYQSFEEAVQLLLRIGPGAVMVKRDLADAFRHIPLHPSCWWLIGLSWRESEYHEYFLPFGL